MPSTRSQRVAVLGAGVAGLTAARELEARGHDVTVFERQERVGGRAWTLRKGFSKGLTAHCGPARFGADFEVLRAAVEAAGLPVTPFYPTEGNFVFVREGLRVVGRSPSDDELPGYAGTEREVAGAGPSVLSRVIKLARRLTGRAQGTTWTLAGGADRFPEALARTLRAPIRTGALVTGVDRGRRRVWVHWRTRERPEREAFDHAVCALPLPAIASVGFTPALSAEKVRLARRIPFSAAVRTFLEMKRAFWREDGLNGFAATDTVGEIWDARHATEDAPALLTCYAQGRLAERLGARRREDRVTHALHAVEKVFPGARRHFVRGDSVSWREQPWIGGGWSVPGDRVGQLEVFRRPAGRLHFAGDYAAPPRFLNTVEGAMRSGERAAREVG